MAFNDLRAELFYQNVLNDAVFAEWVTLRTPDGGERSVCVKCNEQRELQTGERHQNQSETIRVAIGRDESHAKGGLANPTTGSTIERAGDPRRYGFTGKIFESTPYSHLLEFARRQPVTAGGNR